MYTFYITNAFLHHIDELVFVDDTGLKFIFVTPGATGSWLTIPSTPLRSAPGNLDKYPHMLMVLGLMENRFDGI